MISKEMYREHILENYRNPENFGELKNPTTTYKQFNPICGDEIQIQLLIKNNKVVDVKFKGQGCAISIASTSLLTKKIKGSTIKEIKSLQNEDLLDLLKIKINPARLNCALMSLDALKKAIEKC